MKKILMGLLAVSAMSYSVSVDVSAPAQNNTSVFQTGQLGKVSIQAKLTSDIPVIKYAVFTSADGTLEGATDTLVLPDTILTMESGTNVMQGTPNKIYVKRVSGDNQLENLIESDNVEFLATGLDPFYNVHTSDVIPVGNTNHVYPFTSFIAKTELERIVNSVYSGKSPKVNNYGEVEATFGEKTKVLRFPNKYSLQHPTRGVGEVKIVPERAFSEENSMTKEEVKPFLQYATTPITATVYFQVRINN